MLHSFLFQKIRNFLKIRLIVCVGQVTQSIGLFSQIYQGSLKKTGNILVFYQ